jgi:hypothetical protein
MRYEEPAEFPDAGASSANVLAWRTPGRSAPAAEKIAWLRATQNVNSSDDFPPTADLAGLSSADIARELASLSTRRSTTKLEIWFWAGVLGIAAIALVVIVGLFMRAV